MRSGWGRSIGYVGSLVQLAICPVTCGLPTSMSPSCFSSLCSRHRENNEYCAETCKGKHRPPELQLFNLADIENTPHRKDESMATKKEDQCDICGKNKNLVTTYNKKTCSTCGFILRSVKNTPALVVREISELWGNEYFPKQVSAGDDSALDDLRVRVAIAEGAIERACSTLGCPDTGIFSDFVADFVREIREMRNEMDALRTLANQQSVEIQEYIERLAESKQSDANTLYTLDQLRELVAEKEKDLSIACTNNENWRADITQMKKRVSAISDELNAIRELVVTAARNAGVACDYPLNDELPDVLRRVVAHYEEKAIPFGAYISAKPPGRDAALLDIALGALAGKITGVDADLISALR